MPNNKSSLVRPLQMRFRQMHFDPSIVMIQISHFNMIPRSQQFSFKRPCDSQKAAATPCRNDTNNNPVDKSPSGYVLQGDKLHRSRSRANQNARTSFKYQSQYQSLCRVAENNSIRAPCPRGPVYSAVSTRPFAKPPDPPGLNLNNQSRYSEASGPNHRGMQEHGQDLLDATRCPIL